MSDSSLVSYTNLTKNFTKGRSHNGIDYNIDTITIHCTAGKETSTAKDTVDYFYECGLQSKECSSNYCIGGDGSIGLSVEECNRSWCSGGNKTVAGETGSINDFHAVTIEVASSSDGKVVTDKAIEATIALCCDIMKRNGKNKAVWFGNNAEQNVAHKPASNEMKFTWHNFFTTKACPGEFIINKFQYIIDSINKYFANEPVAPVQPMKDNRTRIKERLEAAGLNKYAICGVLSNIYHESGYKPNNLQNNGNTKLGLTDEQFTAKLKSGEYNKETFIRDGYGYGLAQWTYWSRKQAFYEWFVNNNKAFDDLEAQVDYMLIDLKRYSTVWKAIETATSAKEVGHAMCYYYEAPASKDTSSITRGEYADKLLEELYKDEKPVEPEKKYYRVQIGAYTVKANAEAQLAKAKKAGFTDAFIQYD